MLGFASVLVGCSEEVDVHQDRYASLADCVQDWGSEANCTQSGGSAGTGGGGGGGGYSGPRYYWDRSAGTPVVVRDSGVHERMPSAHPSGTPMSHSTGSAHVGSVTRGGFGHSGFGSRGG